MKHVDMPASSSDTSRRVDKDAALLQLEEHLTDLGVHDGECVLCALVVRGSADVVIQTPIAQVRLDRFGCTEGHLMVVPLGHAEHATELTWESYAHLQQLAYQACAVLEQQFNPTRVFVASLGAPRALRQSYPHFHIHIVPVFHEDERARPAHVLSWSSGVTTYTDEQALRLTEQLRNVWPSTPREVSMSNTIIEQSPAVHSAATTPPPSTLGMRRRLALGVRRTTASVLGLFAVQACSTGDSLPIGANPIPTETPSPPSAVIHTTNDELLIPSIGTGPHPTLAGAKDEQAARPIVTGTLLVTADGSTAFASDVDRDVIFRVDLSKRTVAKIPVGVGDEPGQLVEVVRPEGTRVFAVLRAAGALLAIDPSTGETTRYAACSAPRGVTYDALADKLHVACATGELLMMDPTDGSIERTSNLPPDLRDVQVLGQQLVVSRYRSAELLTVGADGEVQSRTKPKAFGDCGEAAVMSRLIASGGTIYAAHQVSTTSTLGTSSGGYGGAGGCGSVPIEPVLVVADDVAVLTSSGDGRITVENHGAASLKAREGGPSVLELGFSTSTANVAFGMAHRAGPLDLAVSATGRIAMTFAGDSLWPQAHAVVTFDATPFEGATQWRLQEYAATGTLTAVAFDGLGQWIAQSRQPALLSFEDGSTLQLDSTSAANTGLDLFYVNTGGGLSCAGCHPEGDEDGRTWSFPQGLRRTQTLGGGVMSREPFHWDGEMPELHTLVDDVMLSRMSFETAVSPEQVGILGRWMDAIPAAPSLSGEGAAGALRDLAAIERGRALFSDPTVACNACHAGPSFTDNKPYDVGTGGIFFTPTLLGIALRDSFMHDGCASTLEQRFGICGGGDTHGKTSHLTRSQIDDLVAYMGTL